MGSILKSTVQRAGSVEGHATAIHEPPADQPKPRMKILYLNAYLNRYDFWTGERGRQFLAALRAAGGDVQTLPAVPDAAPQTRGQSGGLSARLKHFAKSRLPAKALMLLIEAYLVGRGIAHTLQLAWQAWRKRHELRPDVVLARTFEYEWGPWLVAAILRRPLILEVHAPFYVERRFRGRGSSWFFRWYEGKLWRRAARIWVHTCALQKIVTENDIVNERVHVIPFGLPEDRFATEIRRSENPDVRVVFVGSFYAWHGVDLIIEAFAIAQRKVPNLRLCLIGDGVTRAANARRANELGIAERVEFPGWLAQEQVLAYLNESDIGVAPYRWLEPFYFEPVKIMDYMAAGLAVIASNQGQICDLVVPGETGILVPPEDVSALAEALIDLSEDASFRHRLGLAARERVPSMLETAQRVLSTASEVAQARTTDR
jgi:glycosyltransferase involved in cell wall biosynthesis